MGEPGGIGPEICIAAALHCTSHGSATPLIVGDMRVLHARASQSSNIQWNRVTDVANIVHGPHVINVFEPNTEQCRLDTIPCGTYTVQSGRASFCYVETAVHLIKEGWSNRLVTAPISKEAWHAAAVPYTGHTEALAALSNTTEYAMIFVSVLPNKKYVAVVLATRHVALKDVPKYLDEKALTTAITAGIGFLDSLGVQRKRIGICSLNPHAGDNGLVGTEEQSLIVPVLEKCKRDDVVFVGPMSSDAVFHKAQCNELDLVVSMYHDQGIAPLKIISYYSCVNVTFGLPFMRTSPGHGVAFDIAGKHCARPDSMIAATNFSDQ